MKHCTEGVACDISPNFNALEVQKQFSLNPKIFLVKHTTHVASSQYLNSKFKHVQQM